MLSLGPKSFGAVAIVVLAAIPAFASGADGETVPLYTNEDLEQFGPPAERSGVVVPRPDPALQWKFVRQYLDRQYERIDAERQWRMELVRMREEEEARDAEVRSRQYLLLPPFVGYPGFYRHPGRRGADSHGDFGAKTGRGHATAGPSERYDTKPPLREFMSQRDAIHARPTVTRRGHSSSR